MPRPTSTTPHEAHLHQSRPNGRLFSLANGFTSQAFLHVSNLHAPTNFHFIILADLSPSLVYVASYRESTTRPPLFPQSMQAIVWSRIPSSSAQFPSPGERQPIRDPVHSCFSTATSSQPSRPNQTRMFMPNGLRFAPTDRSLLQLCRALTTPIPIRLPVAPIHHTPLFLLHRPCSRGLPVSPWKQPHFTT